MTLRSRGFTLLEVLFALLLLLVGLAGLAGTLGPISKLSGRGRWDGRVALALESRLDRLRAELLATSPACGAPAAGHEQLPDGVLTSWNARAEAGLFELVVTAIRPGSVAPDTLLTRVGCP